MRSVLGSRTRVGARLVARLTHRSRAGGAREIRLWGVPACARCTSIVLGVTAGALVATIWSAPAWIVVACVPAGLDVVAEKLLGLGHRPRLLAATNALAGWALGALLVAIALRHRVLVAPMLLAAPRVALALSAPLRRRRSATASGPAGTTLRGLAA